MSDLFSTSDLTTSESSDNAISLLGLQAGPLLLEKPAFLTTCLGGPEARPANLSAKQAKEGGLMTSGTFGPPSTGSSASGALTSCLGSRLKALLDGRGSILFSLTWKDMVTPAGRKFSLLRASGRRTGGTDPAVLLKARAAVIEALEPAAAPAGQP